MRSVDDSSDIIEHDVDDDEEVGGDFRRYIRETNSLTGYH